MIRWGLSGGVSFIAALCSLSHCFLFCSSCTRSLFFLASCSPHLPLVFSRLISLIFRAELKTLLSLAHIPFLLTFSPRTWVCSPPPPLFHCSSLTKSAIRSGYTWQGEKKHTLSAAHSTKSASWFLFLVTNNCAPFASPCVSPRHHTRAWLESSNCHSGRF